MKQRSSANRNSTHHIEWLSAGAPDSGAARKKHWGGERRHNLMQWRSHGWGGLGVATPLIEPQMTSYVAAPFVLLNNFCGHQLDQRGYI